jgi:cAMP-dependent protein kinase regulator
MTTAASALKAKAAHLTATGQLTQALETWKQTLALAPDDDAAKEKMAEVLAKLGRKAEAVQLYEDLSRRFAEQGAFYKASATCRLLLAVDPTHQRALELISSLYARTTPRPSEPPEFELDVEVEPERPASNLPSIPLFSTLTADELREVLAKAMEVRALSAGEVILREGEAGSSMFALVEGTAGIFRSWGTPAQRRVADVASGDIFGEVAVVSGAPRVATVVADTDAIALEFPREPLIEVVKRYPPVGRALNTFCHERLLANALRASPILRALPEAMKTALLRSFRPRTFNDGQVIFTEG